ncbi:MAG: aspartyl-tRNA synthetase [Microgenomates group bacterium Gr01-1014_93]|nr:MAG: aspartyl-tRNA synthetase [Microgenomates group bacterium Gr01-1014_93]
MDRTLILDCNKKIGEQVKICGFVQVRRDHGKIIFLDVSDRSALIQVVLSEGANVFHLEGGIDLHPQDVVCIEGKVNKRPDNLVNKNIPTGEIEIAADSLEVLSKADPELPIPIIEKGNENEADLGIRMDWRFLDLRKPEKRLIFKVWTVMEQAFRNYCISNDYIEIHSPKLIETATESGSELFEVKYFGKKAHLAQSPQLYKQMAMAAGFEKVFEIGPVFRANPSFTSRHDTEFTMYDIEMSFINSHEDLMAEEEKMVVEMLTAVKEKYGKEIKEVYGQDIVIPKIPFPRLTVKEVKEILAKKGVPNERGEDLSPEGERAICEYILENEGHEFVFIHEWPASVRAFYSMRLESDPSLTKSFDLLWKGLEITSGAQREHRPDQLEEQIKQQRLNLNSFEDYINFFKYGCPPHGGFAPGPTRILMKMLGLTSVREVTYLYRGPNRLRP